MFTSLFSIHTGQTVFSIFKENRTSIDILPSKNQAMLDVDTKPARVVVPNGALLAEMRVM